MPSAKPPGATTPSKAQKVSEIFEKPLNPVARLVLRMIYFIKFSHTDLLELSSALGCTLWGFWVANPFVSSFGDSTVYSKLVQVMPENCFGILVGIFGLAHIYALAATSIRWRKIFCMGAFVVWSFMTLVCWFTDKTAPVIAFFLLFTLLCGLVYLRIDRYYVMRHD